MLHPIFSLMKRLFTIFLILWAITLGSKAQVVNNDGMNQIDESGNITNSKQRNQKGDSLGTDKEIPIGIKVWTIDRRFGDRTSTEPDTLSHMFMNSIFTTGVRGEFNTTGNLGAPRINRIFIDRPQDEQFIFTQPYDFFITPIDKFHFTNTLSPFTNLTYNTCGDRTDGEDRVAIKFGVNAGKRLGLGFNFNYLYGRGYYSSQSTSHLNFTVYGSYLGDHYQAHLLMSNNHQKVTENGGITNDDYIVHPEIYNETFETTEIPTVLSRNWNRNDNQHIFFSQRYSLGFSRKVKMTDDEIKARKFAMEAKKDQEKRDAKEKAEQEAKNNGDKFDEKEFDKNQKETKKFAGRNENDKVIGNEPIDTLKRDTNRIIVVGKAGADSIKAAEKKAQEDTMWLKNEYVPVTSFIHTIEFNNAQRIYEAYQTPVNYYLNTYKMDENLLADSIYDKTRYYNIKNTFAISLLEGFNKWAKAGLKAFVSHEMRDFVLPDSVGTRSWKENTVTVGGQLIKTQGRLYHYNILAEFGVAGEDAGSLKVDAAADLNFKLFGDTVSLAASGFFYRNEPTFYYRHYASRHYKWDNNLDNITHTRLQGILSWQKTHTSVRVAVDEITNYTYFGLQYSLDDSKNQVKNDINVRQSSEAISLLTLQLMQDFKFGPLNWESVITYQKSSMADIIPVPDLNIYTNLYLKFKIAKVLKCDFGFDVRYFSKYYAPYYAPGLGQYCVQEGDNRTEVGNYPIVNVYANFHLKRTRFFVMMSHVNEGLMSSSNYFLTPHYPLNQRILRFGLSWNFFN
jgi:hypothetical protein